MKKLFLLVVMTLFVATTLEAQEMVTLKLKSGFSVTGQIIEENGAQMKIRTAEGDIFIYRTNEIARIEGMNGNSLESAKKTRVSKGLGDFKGYRSILEFSGSGTLSYAVGMATMRVSLSYVGGYNFNSHLYVGLGAGLAVSNPCGDSSFEIPVYLHLRSAFLKGRRVSPYISMNIGYNIGMKSNKFYTTDEFHTEYSWSYRFSGFYIEPTIGAELRLKKKSALMLGVTIPLILGDPLGEGGGYTPYAGIGVKAGFSF